MAKMSFKEEYWSSVKSPDTEEKIDLYFYRFLGFIIAKTLSRTPITPTQVTVTGMFCGIYGGYLLSVSEFFGGAFLFLLSGILDSADGQLARMTKKTSPLGVFIDGICDQVVFASVYFFCSWALVPTYGYWIFGLTAAAFYAHIFHTIAYDYYNREYLYFGAGKTQTNDYWNPSVEEVKNDIENSQPGLNRLIQKFVRLSWVQKQKVISTRSDEARSQMRQQQTQIQATYRQHHFPLLKYWHCFGPNAHTIGILASVFFEAFEWYLLGIDLVLFSILFLIVYGKQKKADEVFFQCLGRSSK